MLLKNHETTAESSGSSLLWDQAFSNIHSLGTNSDREVIASRGYIDFIKEI